MNASYQASLVNRHIGVLLVYRIFTSGTPTIHSQNYTVMLHIQQEQVMTPVFILIYRAAHAKLNN